MDNLTYKTGARVRIITSAGESDWGSNLILNSATKRMETGYDVSPDPILGQSIVPVNATQTGVQAPLPNMKMVRKIENPPKYAKTNDRSARAVTVTRYYFRNDDAVIANVSEIGYLGLNRALFVDGQGIAKSWAVAAGEEVIIEVEFTIVMTVSSQPIQINVVDQDDAVLDTITVNMLVSFPPNENPGEWWKLLRPSTSNNNVFLVFDQNWDGAEPSDAGAFISKPAKFVYKNRNIHVEVEHVGAAGGQTVKGFYLRLDGRPPFVCAVFDKPLHIGGNYVFRSEMSIDW